MGKETVEINLAANVFLEAEKHVRTYESKADDAGSDIELVEGDAARQSIYHVVRVHSMVRVVSMRDGARHDAVTWRHDWAS